MCRQPARDIPHLARTAHIAGLAYSGRLATGVTRLAPLWIVEPDPDAPLGFDLLPIPGAQPPSRALLFPVPESSVRYATLAHWRRLGAEEFWFLEADGWHIVDAANSWSRRFFQRTIGRVTRRCSPWLDALGERKAVGLAVRLARRQATQEMRTDPDGAVSGDAWENFIARDNETLAAGDPLAAGRPLKVVHYGSALYSGGAERQICNLILGQQQLGFDVRLRTTYSCRGDRGHYQHLLAAANVDSCIAAAQWLETPPQQRIDADLLYHAPRQLQDAILALCAELYRHRPDVLHCWLDEPNIIGGIAGLLAGVPRILLSVRNSNPTNFPRFFQSYMEEWYRRLGKSRRVHLLSNSRSGATSYAHWMHVPEKRFHLVSNGIAFSHFPQWTAEDRRRARQAFGFSDQDRVVCGVFRLDKEKQPDVFLQVIQATAERFPALRVLWAGGGPLHEEIAARIRQQGLSERVRLLGACRDVGSVLLASDAMLLTSEFEGCPNAAIEAQFLGVPVVATRAGGTVDSVLDGQTGFLAQIGDVAALTNHLTRLLEDGPLRDRLAEQGRQFASREFAIDQMVDLHTLTYCRLFEPVESSSRVVSPLLARLECDRAYVDRVVVPGRAEPQDRVSTLRPVFAPLPETDFANPELTLAEAERLDAIPGSFHPFSASGAHRLARLARGPVVVVGIDLGKPAAALLLGTPRRRKVHAILTGNGEDPESTNDFLAFHQAMRPWRDRLIVLHRPSRGVRWRARPIGGLLLASGEQAEADLASLSMHLRPDAILALHGYLPVQSAYPGLRRFVEEALLQRGEWWWDDFRGTLLTLRRVSHPHQDVIEHNRSCLDHARAGLQILSHRFGAP